MLDDLREEADFVEDDELNYDYQDGDTGGYYDENLFLGMTPVQRFVIAVMFLMMVCILGAFFLLVTETVMIPV